MLAVTSSQQGQVCQCNKGNDKLNDGQCPNKHGRPKQQGNWHSCANQRR
jgi:hypothetical protein